MRVEWGTDDAHTLMGTGTEAVASVGSKRWPVLAALAVVGVIVAGALASLGRSESPNDAAPTPTTEAEATAAAEPSEPVRVDQRLVDAASVELTSIARAGDRWAATATDRADLLWSEDGLVWFEEPQTSPRGVERVFSSNDETLVVQRRERDDGVSFETLQARDGQWIVDTTRAPIEVGESRVLAVDIGGATVVVTESPMPALVPEVIGLIEEFVSPQLAQQTCLLNRTLVESSELEYALFDCDGDEIGAIDTVPMGSRDDDRLAFAESVLRKRTIVHVSTPGAPAETVPLGPGQVILDMELVDDGFVAFILDPIEVIDEASLLYSQAFEASLIRWDAANGLERLETPVRTSAWSANRAIAQPDGSMLITSPVGVHHAEPPFTEWELLSTGPFDPPRPGHVVETPLLGEGLFVIDAADPAVVHVSCCGSAWETIRLGQADVESLLVIAADHFLMRTSSAPFVRVER